MSRSAVVFAMLVAANLHPAWGSPVAIRFAVAPPAAEPPTGVWVMPVYQTAPDGPLAPCPFTLDADAVVVALEPGSNVALFFARADGTYVVAGPLRWPSSGDTVTIGGDRRRSVSARIAARVEAPVWVSAGTGASDWPRCAPAAIAASVECHGVPVDSGGVIVARLAGGWAAAAVPAVGDRETPDRVAVAEIVLKRLVAGALLVPVGGDEPCAGRVLRVRPSAVLSGTRYVSLEDSRSAEIQQVAARAFWVATTDRVEDGSVVRVTCPEGGVRIDLRHVAAGSPLVPIIVPTDLYIPGRVSIVDARHRPLPRALLDVYAPSVWVSSGDGEETRWEDVGSFVAAGDGTAEIRTLPRGRYEFRAQHPQGGRVTVTEEWKPGGLTLVLRAGHRVTGRVVQNDAPVAGLWVRALPALDVVVGAPDALDLIVAPTLTGADGRFALELPADRPMELRIGDEPGAVRRVPVPAGRADEETSLGDLALSAPITVTATLVLPEGCDLVATGPAGRTGLALVQGTRAAPGEWALVLPEPGAWYVSALCGGGREVPLAPTVIEIPPDVTGWRILLTPRAP